MLIHFTPASANQKLSDIAPTQRANHTTLYLCRHCDGEVVTLLTKSKQQYFEKN